MLQKPGSGSSASAYTSRRKAAQESPDDIVKKRSRFPANKKCCDCGSKLPNSVNLTVGAFLCQACAGIHRELPSAPRIKGIGHTVFTREEAEFLEGTDNDQINALYLAGYNPSVERLRMPTDNTDLHLLRSWINRKYKDKAWYRENGAAAGAPQPSGDGPPGRGIAGSMRQPTVVANIPPKAATAPAAALDLFDAGNSGHNPAVSANGGWDAFGRSSVAAATPSNAAFSADFGSTLVQSSNFASFPAQSQPQQQPPQQQQSFPGQPPPPPTNFANFEQPAATTTPNQANNTFANFPSPPSMPNQQMGYPNPQQFPPPSQNAFGSFPNPMPQSTHESFGNFSGPQMQQQQQQQQQPQMQQQHPQQMQQQQQQQPQPPQIQQQQQPPQMQQNAANFANFGMPSPTGPSPQNFASFSPGLTQPAFPTTNQPPPSPPHFNGAASQSMPQNEPPATANGAPLATAALDKFDAFNSLNISPPPSSTTPVETKQPPLAEKATALNTSTDKAKAQISTYTTGQTVYYKSASYCGAAEILKVHFDDELEPFYTIKVQDKEKQTDDKHLDAFSPLITELHQLLSNLSDDKLNMVKQYITQLSGAPSTGGASPFAGLSQAPPVPSLSGSTPGMMPPPSSIPSSTAAPVPPGGTATPIPQLAPTSGGNAPLSPHINGSALPSVPSQPTQQHQSTPIPGPTVPMPSQVTGPGNATMMPPQPSGGTLMSPPANSTGGDFSGIPSPTVDVKPGLSNPNGMPPAPMVSGPMPPGNASQPPVQQPRAPGQMQFSPPMPQNQTMPQPQGNQGQMYQQPQMPPQAPQTSQFHPTQGQQVQQMPPQQFQQMPPQQFQQMSPQQFQQMPPQQFQQHMTPQQFQQQIPPQQFQQQVPQQQQMQMPQQQQMQMPQQQMQMPQQQQMQMPQQQQMQMPQQQQMQVPQQQAPPSPMSPKGNPFDFY